LYLARHDEKIFQEVANFVRYETEEKKSSSMVDIIGIMTNDD